MNTEIYQQLLEILSDSRKSEVFLFGFSSFNETKNKSTLNTTIDLMLLNDSMSLLLTVG